MTKKFLKALAGFLAYMGILAGGVFAWFDPTNPPGEGQVALLTIGMMATFPFAMEIIGRWAFRFRGTGKAIPLADLKAKILAINLKDIPVVVTERGNTLTLTWKHLDERWSGIMMKEGITQSYSLLVRLNEKRRVATLIDVTRSIEWSVDSGSARLGFLAFRGVNFDFQVEKNWGIDELIRRQSGHFRSYKSGDIRNPVLNEILRSGWDARLGIF